MPGTKNRAAEKLCNYLLRRSPMAVHTSCMNSHCLLFSWFQNNRKM